MAAAGKGEFGGLLRRLRLSAGLTQEALAERAGVSAKAIGELERNPTRIPRLDSVALLADALELDQEGRGRLLAAARPAQLPPAPSSSPFGLVSGTVPRSLTPLFGRAGVIGAVAELLRRGSLQEGARLITLTGPGGVGKTRVAIAAAEEANREFADGVVFVDLAPLRDPRLVIDAVAGRVGADERDKHSLHDRLAAALRRKHLLLILDNVEHLLPARNDVLALLEACPRLVVLATSRVALRVRAEREYRIAPLELPEPGAALDAIGRSPAVALFLDRARASGADLELSAVTTPAVAEICNRLDGLPLALELAAAWSRLLSPQALLARLERRLPLLVGGPHDLPARQRTMRATIAWSYELLDAGEQHLFRRLCVFAAGCTPAAAEAICADPTGDDVLPGLAALVDRSFLLARNHARADDAERRLTILETLREYGLERLEESGEADTVRRRHAGYYLTLAEEATTGLRGPEAAAWGARLEREHDNVRAGLDWALACGDSGMALRVAGAQWRFWSERGHLSEGRRWLRASLELPSNPDAGDTAARVRALVGAAQLASDQGDFDEAETRITEAVTLARASDVPADLIVALNVWGQQARERGAYHDAIAHHDEALAFARTLGDRAGEAEALTGLGFATGFSGDIAQGIAFTEQALGLLREDRDTRALAAALGGMAAHLTHSGDFARAEAIGWEALALFRLLGDTGQVAGLLFGLGIVLHYREEYGRAAELHEEALALRRKRGDEHGTIESLAALAATALRQHDYQRARVSVEEALEVLDRYEDRWVRSMSLALLGHVDLAMGKLTDATVCFAEGASLMRAIGNPLHMPVCLEGLAGVAAARGEWNLATRLCGARDALRAELGLGMPPADPIAYSHTLAACREALGHDYATAYEAGRALTPDDALAEAGIAVTFGA